MEPWEIDIESLERVSQDGVSRRLVLRMAQLSREGRLRPFLSEISSDPDFDEDTRKAIAELGRDRRFLLAVEDYLGRTSVLH
jgi:hypothetical protein